MRVCLVLPVLVLLFASSCDNGTTSPTAPQSRTSPVRALQVALSPSSVFGPERFTRREGKPQVDRRTIDPAGFAGPYTLHVQNGNESGQFRVSSARIALGEVTVLSPDDFARGAGSNGKGRQYDVPVTLPASTELTVEFAGAPGSFLTIWIEGTQATLPPVPEVFDYPSDTIAFPITPWIGVGRYYTNLVGIRFRPDSDPAAAYAVLVKYSAEIVGGFPNRGAYIVRVNPPEGRGRTLQELLASLHAEPTVEYPFPLSYVYVVEPTARFPNDAAGMRRADWLDRYSSPTWAFKAVRAIEAWGCETGMYGAGRVSVGIYDYAFDTSHEDLAPSIRRVLTPRGLVPDGRASRELYMGHGTLVAGMLTAEGDNGKGLPGIMWRTDLTLYPFGQINTGVVPDALAYLSEVVLPDATRTGVRVFVASGNLPAADTGTVSLIADGIQEYLNGDGLLVLAGRNEHRTFTTAELAALYDYDALLAAAIRVMEAGYRSQILIVGGSQPGPARWVTDDTIGSNEIVGAMPLAAPAYRVPALYHSAFHPGDGFAPNSGGTSIAAPMVAGVAAQLISMDPSLTASEVYDYLVRGARRPRFNPNTGTLTPPPPVSGFSSEVHQLDAYGALSLLASERLGTPVCGFPVSVSGDGTRLLLERNPAAGFIETLAIPEARRILRPSVARGGRLIAVADDPVVDGATADLVRVISHRGVVRQSIEGLSARQYLERDTADTSGSFHNDEDPMVVTIRRHDGTKTTLSPLDVVDPHRDRAWRFQVSVSDAASTVALSAAFFTDPTYTWGLYSIDLATSRVTAIDEGSCAEEGCEGVTPDIFMAAWTRDGDRLIAAGPHFVGEGHPTSSRVLVADRDGSVTRYSLPGVWAEWVQTEADNLLIELTEYSPESDTCSRTRRALADPARVAARYSAATCETTSRNNARVLSIVPSLAPPGARR